jgi:hypothetical protein
MQTEKLAMGNKKISHPYRDYWKEYLDLGLIPLPARGKSPIIEWSSLQEEPLRSDDYAKFEDQYGDHNIWVLLGDYLVVDPECPEAEKFVQSLNLPKCPTSITRGKSIHRWFKNNGTFKPFKFIREESTFLEIRTGKMGMLAPASIHPDTGKPYQWVEGLSPWDVDFPEFPQDAYEKILSLKLKTNPDRASSADNSNMLDVGQYLSFHKIPFNVKEDPDRTIYRLEHCLFENKHHDKSKPGDAAIIQGKDGKLGYMCFHNHCAGKTWADVRQSISGDKSLAQFMKEPIEKSGKSLVIINPTLTAKHEINMADRVRQFIEQDSGIFDIQNMYYEIGAVSFEEKHAARQAIFDLVQKGTVQRTGTKRGCYRRVEGELIGINLDEPEQDALPLSLPFQIENLVDIYPKNLIVVAGSQDAGKTSFLLNAALLNTDKFKIRYLTSEMGQEELAKRIRKFNVPLAQWKKIQFFERSANFEDVVLCDGFTLIDFFEISDEFFKIAANFKAIFDQLKKGICMIALQKGRKNEAGRGGSFRLELPRLYLSINPGILTIVKAKMWHQEGVNPNGLQMRFKLINGAEFIPIGGWRRKADSEELAA